MVSLLFMYVLLRPRCSSEIKKIDRRCNLQQWSLSTPNATLALRVPYLSLLPGRPEGSWFLSELLEARAFEIRRGEVHNHNLGAIGTLSSARLTMLAMMKNLPEQFSIVEGRFRALVGVKSVRALSVH